MFKPVFSRTLALAAFLPFAPIMFAQQQSQPATLTIQVDKPIAKVSPTLYGLMTEEINYSYDGGLYGELVRDRVLGTSWQPLNAYTVVQKGNARASIAADKSTGPSSALSVSLKLQVDEASSGNEAGVSNSGYWGIPVHPNTTYHASFYAKAADPSVGPVTVSIVDDRTGSVVAKASVPAIGADWKQYSVDLKTGTVASSALNHVTLTTEHAGTIWFNLVSLFPPTYHDRANGNRIDLMEKLAAMHPAFLRFPGGNYLEGDHISERFEWKKTIGPLVDRPTHPSPWGYHSSDGMGLLEFLEWCEDLKMQPVLAVYAGYSMKQEHVDPGPDLDPYVQDALDEIEYVTGDRSTRWGAQRIKDGHPAPFPLTYIEIGNEDWFDKSNSYDGRYAQFYKAIKARYPQLQLIATTPVASVKPDVVDDHFYRRAEEFYTDTHHYDKVDRNGPKIFVGEWATMQGTPTPDFGAALGDAAWMTGMERNSDLIVMASYAPLFTNVNPGGLQWRTNLIGYDALNSYGSPSYYMQVMFDSDHGTEVVDSKQDGGGPRFFYSTTRDEAKGILYLKLVNASSTDQPVKLDLSGVQNIGKTASLISLSANTTEETNSIIDPNRIVPVEKQISGMGSSFNYIVPQYAIQVLEIKLK